MFISTKKYKKQIQALSETNSRLREENKALKGVGKKRIYKVFVYFDKIRDTLEIEADEIIRFINEDYVHFKIKGRVIACVKNVLYWMEIDEKSNQ